MDTIRVFVGTEPNQYVTQQVLANSIRQRVSGPVEIRFCTQDTEKLPRVGGTNFGFVRFLLPFWCDYAGRAIYLDADQVALADIRGLWESLPNGASVACVQDAEGFFGDKQVERANQTSVMVMDCDQLRSWDPNTLFDQVVTNKVTPQNGQIRYRDFMKLGFFDQSKVAALDPSWNHFNIVRADTRLVHFSHVRSQPWKNPGHSLTGWWTTQLRSTLRRGGLGRRELWREIRRQHVHPMFMRYVFLP